MTRSIFTNNKLYEIFSYMKFPQVTTQKGEFLQTLPVLKTLFS